MKTSNITAAGSRSHRFKPRTLFSAVVLSVAVAACGGGGGGSTPAPTPTPAPSPSPTPTPGSTVTVSGRITFDSVPFSPGSNTGLDFAHTIQAPARGIVVEALDAANTSAAALASTVTSATGSYALVVPAGTNVIVRAKAQLLATGSSATWNFRLLNNTNADALYALDSATPFNTGATDIPNKNLNAPSGWNGSTYLASSTRAAAPFAILDTVYNAVQLVLSAQPQITFPPFNLYWSVANKNLSPFCPISGAIDTTAFHTGDSLRANCVSQTESTGGIYVLGDFASGEGDTDEFDTHVIAHEFGHYIEHNFSRSDSIGGSHSGSNKLDLRVAMSEGWGNAFSGMALNDPVYRDSSFRSGAPAGFSFNMEGNAFPDMDTNGGWYSETSIQQVLWDLFDSQSDAGDNVFLGFGPIFQALQGRQKVTPALTSIFSFLNAVEAVASNSTSAINQLAGAHGINSVDPFAAGESNNGGDGSVIPIYKDLAIPSTTSVCSDASSANYYNKIGNRKFLKIVSTSSLRVAIQVTGAVDPAVPLSKAASNPDFILWANGAVLIDGTNDGSNLAVQTAPQTQVPVGTYVLEVYDFTYNDPGTVPNDNSPHCMSVSITGS
jgi:hypothetical protein